MEAIWPSDIAEAKEIQSLLRQQIKIVPIAKKLCYITAVDAAFSDSKIIAAASTYKYPEMTWIEDSFSSGKIDFPYIPGFLSFREGKEITNAIKNLNITPDLILFDGHGIAHPTGIGIASHIGVILGIPTVGCAKSRLVGIYEEPDNIKGHWSYLIFNGEKVGVVLRTKVNVRPIFISPGHLIDIESSVKIVMSCVKKYRIPEPLRRADLLSKKLKHIFSCQNKFGDSKTEGNCQKKDHAQYRRL